MTVSLLLARGWNLRLKDRAYKIFLNTKGVMEGIHPDLSNFLRYIENSQVSDE